MANFDPSSVSGLLGLWDFKTGAATADTGLDDGIAQNGHFQGHSGPGGASGDRAHFNGSQWFDVDGDDGGPKDSVFDLSKGTVEVQFTQDQHVGSSPDTLVNRGEYHDRTTEGWFGLQVTKDGAVTAQHFEGGQSASLSTSNGFFKPGDVVNAKYTWDETSGVQLVVTNVTTGATETVSSTQSGLTLNFNIGDNDDEIFTFGARESNDGHYDEKFDGSIDYVAIYESPNAQPDGAVDGEDFAEVMELGYDDANAPTDQGGDIITNDADLIFGNGGNDTISGEGGDDTIYGDNGVGSASSTAGTPTTLDVGSLSGGRITSPNGEVSASVDFGQSFNGFDGWQVVQPGFNGAQDQLFYANSVFEGRQNVLKLDFEGQVQNLSFTIYDVNAASWDDQVTIVGIDANGNQVPVRFTNVDDQIVNGNTITGNTAGSTAQGAELNDNNTYNVTANIDDPIVELRVILESAPGGPSASGYIALGEFNVTPVVADTGGAGSNGSDGGDDVIDGDAGNDLIFGEAGNDTIDGGTGNDTILGDGGDDAPGGTFTGPRESFNWDLVSGSQADSSVTQDTGDVTVTYTRFQDTGAHESDIDNATPLNVTGIDGGSETVDTNSALTSETSGNGNTGAFRWVFDAPVGNVDFNINDLDGDGRVTVRAFDADGNEVPVTLTGGSGINISGNTAAGNLPYQDTNNPASNVQVDIAGPVSRIEVVHTQVGSNNSGIWVTDMYYDTGFVPETSGDNNGNDLIEGGIGDDVTYGDDGTGRETLTIAQQIADQDGAGGDDTFVGGEGADQSWGEGGNDTVLIRSAAEGAGDVVVGGNGPDQTTDNDTLDLRGAGKVTIVAEADDSDTGAQKGTVTFEDGSSLQFFQIETILTDPQNTGPDAVNDTVTVNEDDSVTFNPLANDSDPDGDPLTIVSISDPANGTLTDNGDGTFTYQPAENYNGPDSVTYTIQDPSNETSTATVTFNVTPVNDAPDAVNDTAVTDEEVAVTLTPLDNDTDVDGDDLTITAASVPASQGVVTVAPDGKSIEFVPAEDFFGEATVSYAITDGNGGTDTAEIAVTVNNVNDAPDAVDDIVATDEDTSVTFNPAANDTDPDGDPLVVTSVGPVDPAQGTAVLNPDGTVTFTPAPNFNGPVDIPYTVDDGQGGTDTGTSTVNVGATPDAPDAVDDSATTDEDTPIQLFPLANDSDPDGDDLTITGASVPPAEGTVTVAPDGKSVTFTPAPDFNGPATISYAITDGNGGTDSAEIAVTVTPVNDAPEAVDDIENTDEDTPVTFNPAANDTDVDGDPLVVTAVGPVDPAQGTAVLNPNGTVTFTPAPNFNGPVEIPYTVSDGQGGTDTGTTLVNVGPVNDAPDAVDDTETTDQGTPVTISPLGNDSDPDGDPITVIGASVPPSQGTVTFTPTTVVFTPAPAFVGAATISYTISDGNGLTDTANIAVTVNDVIGPVDGLDAGELMQPGYTDVEGDQIDGTDGNDDTIFGNGGDDTIDGGLGNDTIDGGAGDDDIVLTGGIDDDSVIGGEAGETEGDRLDASGLTDDLTVVITAPETGTVTDGTDTTSFAEIEVVETGSGNDTVTGSDGGDAIVTNGGADSIVAGAGDDTVDAGDGQDTVDGGAGNDSLLGGDEADTILGGDDNDTIDGGRGGDSLDGGAGDDSILGGNDSDTIVGSDGADTVDGGEGNNVIDTSGAANLVDDKNGDGFGFASYGPFPPAPADGAVGDDADLVTSGSGNDSITTGDDADTIRSGAGDDTIDSGIDNDSVEGGAGADLITTGEGADTVLGGSGDDTIYGGLGPTFPSSTDIPDAPAGGSFGPDPDTENGRDLIDGGQGNDLIFGEDDDDTLMGGNGADTLDGGIDDDLLQGEAGQDDLIGGQGADTMEGGDDRDEFFINAREDGFGDVIDGGTGGNDVDRLDLRGLGRFEIVNETVDADGDSTSGTVNFLDANDNIEGSLSFTEIENVIPCFTPGALIATPRGEVPVEELQLGDRVITRDDGIQEIQWIGTKQISAQEMTADPRLKPIMIRKGALGAGLPERDMMVSPNHRMLIANETTQMLFDEREVLVAAKHLTGQAGIHKVDLIGTEYIHVMFDRHQVILGDGAWTESFQPGDQTLGGFDQDQRDEIFKLFPSLEEAEGRNAYASARQTLKAFEAKTLRGTMGLK